MVRLGMPSAVDHRLAKLTALFSRKLGVAL